MIRRGVAELLEVEPDLQVVGEAGTVREALVRIPLVRPRVAVLDVRLPDGNGVELCRDLKAELPDLVCLMLTSFTQRPGTAGRAHRRGRRQPAGRPCHVAGAPEAERDSAASTSWIR